MNQLLFYQNIVALDRQKHHDWKLTTPINLDFAAQTNFIPIVLSEVSEVAQELPILFIPIGDQEFALSAITGVQKNTNLLIERGAWRGRYVPAFLRRYPFITVGKPEDKSQFTIAIDEQAQCLHGKGIAGLPNQHQKLFDGDKPSQKLQELIPFLQRYHTDNQQTYAFCKRLHELNLLTQSDLAVQDRFGNKYQVNGGYLIDEKALHNLTEKLVHEFFSATWLQKIYQIQFSLKNFPWMLERFGKPLATSPKAPTKQSAAQPNSNSAKSKLPAAKPAKTAAKTSATKKVVPKKTKPAAKKTKK